MIELLIFFLCFLQSMQCLLPPFPSLSHQLHTFSFPSPFCFPISSPSFISLLTLSFPSPPHTQTLRSMKRTDPELSPANRMFLYKHKYMIRTPHLNWISNLPLCGREISPQLPLKGESTNLGSPYDASIHLKIYPLWTCKHCLVCLMWFKITYPHTHKCTYGKQVYGAN